MGLASRNSYLAFAFALIRSKA